VPSARQRLKRLPIKRIVEVAVSRLVPGALNVLALLVLAWWLSRESYGLASTYIATATAASDLLFGGIIYSTLVHYSEQRARGKHERYESLHVANTLLLASAISAVGFAFAAAGLFNARLVAVSVAFGTYTSIQEISHARLQFYRFAIGSCAQSLVVLGLAFAMVRPDPTVANTLDAFALSYALGALISVVLVRPRITMPSLTRLRSAFGLGSIPTLSNLGVSIFALGCRYLLLFFDRRDALGVFSFSLDIAQRGVGIFINLATFALVPQALKNSQGMHAIELWNALKRGWTGAVAVSLFGAATIMAIAATHLFGPFNRPVYQPISFGLICIAVIVARSSKMVLSPVAMRLRRTRVLLQPLFFIAPAALGMLMLGLHLRIPYSVELVYTFAFIAWAVSSYRALVPQLQESAAAPAGRF
jgi:hypothetical protein